LGLHHARIHQTLYHLSLPPSIVNKAGSAAADQVAINAVVNEAADATVVKSMRPLTPEATANPVTVNAMIVNEANSVAGPVTAISDMAAGGLARALADHTQQWQIRI